MGLYLPLGMTIVVDMAQRRVHALRGEGAGRLFGGAASRSRLMAFGPVEAGVKATVEADLLEQA